MKLILQKKEVSYMNAAKQPKWLDDAIFYQIYPQSFMDSNSDGIGDLNGIIQRLDYIKYLGCNAIWVNPCFESPFIDAGYDVSDYCTVAARYGTNQDMKKLIDEVHSRDMHILLDLVPGHTSNQHKWFKESAKPYKNEYTDRYVWTDSIWTEPSGMNTLRGGYDRDATCIVNFFTQQPALNYGFFHVEQPWQQSMNDEGPRSTLEAMKNVMRFWLKMGCDGFRVDMAGSLVKNDDDGKGTVSLWQNVRAFLDKEFPNAAMISEWGEPDKSLMGGFHMDFLLHFGSSHYNDLFRCEHPFFSAKGNGDVFEFVEKYKENYAKTGGSGLICVPSGNHDMDRIARNVTGDQLKIAFAFLLSLPGAPFIYYGDEIGMRYVENLASVEGGYGRTGSRSPMQWDDTLNSGFSNASPEKLYIPPDPDPDRPTVKDQVNTPDSLLNEVRKLIDIRRQTSALMNKAAIEFIYAEKNSYPLAYLRKSPDQTVLVVINPSSDPCIFDFNGEIRNVIYSFGDTVELNSGTASVAPDSAGYYLVEM